MTSLILTPLVQRASMFAAVVLLAAGVTQAQQSNLSSDSSTNPSYSSSQAGLEQFQLAELSAPAVPSSSAAASGGGATGQYGTSGGGHGFHGIFHHWTFEAGAGFNAPTSHDVYTLSEGTQIPYVTWGANFTLGGGLRFNNRLSLLAEYQFMDDKLPGAFLSVENQGCGDCGIVTGDAHINSITGSPVIDLFPKKTNGAYLVGGGGWYHYSTNLNGYECCDIYGDEVPVTVGSFSSNQWGANAGLGLYHKLGNIYGDTSHNEFFAEARFTFIHTPSASQANGLGTTELIPVTIGFRF